MKKNKPTDGLGPYEIAKIRSAVRMVWHRSMARRLVVRRCTDEDKYLFCETCLKKTPILKIDHIVPAGKVDAGYIDRMFCSSVGLQGMCVKCHTAKTRLERNGINTESK